MVCRALDGLSEGPVSWRSGRTLFYIRHGFKALVGTAVPVVVLARRVGGDTNATDWVSRGQSSNTLSQRTYSGAASIARGAVLHDGSPVLAKLGERGVVYGWAEKERCGAEIAPSCMDTRRWVT